MPGSFNNIRLIVISAYITDFYVTAVFGTGRLNRHFSHCMSGSLYLAVNVFVTAVYTVVLCIAVLRTGRLKSKINIIVSHRFNKLFCFIIAVLAVEHFKTVRTARSRKCKFSFNCMLIKEHKASVILHSIFICC